MATPSAVPDARPAAEVLAQARTVALIVHGVGDHTPSNILEELDLGLKRTLEQGSFETERVLLADVLQPSGVPGREEVGRVQTSSGEHYMIPIVWSREHLRAGAEASSPFLYPGGSIQRLQFLIAKALRPMLQLTFNTFRCVPKGAGPKWKGALLLVAVLVLAVVAALMGGSLLLMASLPYLLHAWTHSFTSWPYLIAVGTLPSLILIGLWRSLPGLDMAGDVVFYVGQPKRRAEIEERMREIIAWAKRAAPLAEITVVGHSLGSVLVSHSLAGMAGRDGRRLLLVTLGSPLPMMSTVFSQHIFSPSQLLDIYAQNQAVTFWLHMWRDADWIGRGLHVQSGGRFAEASVGDGMHPNYWRDARIWGRLVALMEAQRAGTTQVLVEGWATAPLTQSEGSELMQVAQGFRALGLLTLVAYGALVYLGRDVFSAALASAASARWLLLLKALYVASYFPLIPLCFADLVARAGGTPRQLLGRLRFVRSLYGICIWLWLGLGVAFLSLRWAITRF